MSYIVWTHWSATENWTPSEDLADLDAVWEYVTTGPAKGNRFRITQDVSVKLITMPEGSIYHTMTTVTRDQLWHSQHPLLPPDINESDVWNKARSLFEEFRKNRVPHRADSTVTWEQLSADERENWFASALAFWGDWSGYKPPGVYYGSSPKLIEATYDNEEIWGKAKELYCKEYGLINPEPSWEDMHEGAQRVWYEKAIRELARS